MISKEVLQNWHTLMEDERYNTLMTDMEKVLAGGKSSYAIEEYDPTPAATPDVPPKFSEIKIGDTYKFGNLSGKHRIISGAPVVVTKKNRTKVVVAMKETWFQFKKGHELTTPPELLRKTN